MNRFRITFISLLLVAIMLMTAACSSKTPEGEQTSEQTSDTEQVTSAENETTAEQSNELVLVTDGDNDYTIIRPEKAESYEISAAVALNAKLMEIYDDLWERNLKDDFVKGKKGEIIVNNEKEILIGYTNRKESRDIYETLGTDEYIIRAVNNKIVIIGQNQYATSAAVTEFIEKYVRSADGKELRVPNDINVKGACELRKIPLYEGASYRIMSYNLGCAVGVADDAATIIMNYLPDIIGLQETDKTTHKNVVAKLPDIYAIANEFHSNGKPYNYTPIIYNKNLFTLKDSGLEWLVGRYTGTNTKSIAWALFEDKDGKTFAVINFHGAVCSASYKGFENMTAAERNQQALTWRLDNVRQIIEIKDRIFAKHGSVPLMVTGDYNFNSTSEPYKNLTAAGFEEAEVIAKNKTTGYKTSFTYGSITAAASGNSIDHVFKLNGIEFVRFDSVRDKLVFTASDHLPIYTDFNIK